MLFGNDGSEAQPDANHHHRPMLILRGTLCVSSDKGELDNL
jgi:hypothetical protein